MHRFLRAGLAVAIVVLSGCWLAPNQGPDRSGHNTVERALSPATAATLTEQWHSDAGLRTGLVADGARVYATGYGVMALAASTGRPLWTRAFDWRFQVRDGFVDGDEVRLHVRLLESFTWEYDAATGGPGDGSDDGASGLVAIRGPRELRATGVYDHFASTFTDVLQVVERPTGAVRWQATAAFIDDLGTSPPEYTLGTHRLYATGHGLLATTPGDGAQGPAVRAYPADDPARDCGPAESPTWACPIWVTPLDGNPAAAAVLSPDEASIYVVTDTGRAYALDAATGAARWTADLGAPPRGEPALAAGRLYAATADGRLLAFDTAACAAGRSPCAPAWTATAGTGPLAGQPAVAGGVVVVGAAEGAVRAYDAAGCGTATCDPLWTGTVAGPVSVPPIVSGGRVFVLDGTGRLTAFAPTPAPRP